MAGYSIIIIIIYNLQHIALIFSYFRFISFLLHIFVFAHKQYMALHIYCTCHDHNIKTEETNKHKKRKYESGFGEEHMNCIHIHSVVVLSY